MFNNNNNNNNTERETERGLYNRTGLESKRKGKMSGVLLMLGIGPLEATFPPFFPFQWSFVIQREIS